jgi:endoglycosylceramidase
VNVIEKAFPWHPGIDTFDAMSSLSPEDMVNLKSWGLNSVRLGVMWPGVEPVEGQFNQTYLTIMRKLVDDLYEHGIYTVVDFHQDVLNERWCGEGVPAWLIPKLGPISTECKGLVPWVAKLIGLCTPFSKYNFSLDPATGYPRTEQCLQHAFTDYDESPDVVSAWGAFLSNQTIINNFRQYWHAVAATFAGAPGVLGYDLVNEPLAGDYYSNNSLLKPGVADPITLQPVYKQLHDEIRTLDKDAIIFYEPPPFPDTVPLNTPVSGGVHPVGFTAGPAGRAGAAEWSSKQAMSYHIYSCGFSGAGCTADGDPLTVECPECEELVESWVETRHEDVRRLGGGLFITEFGAVSSSKEGLGEIVRVTSKADTRLQSWAYWQFKYYHDITTVSGPIEGFYWPNGTLQQPKVKALARTYAPAIAGTPQAMGFDAASGAFRLVFTAPPVGELCWASSITKQQPLLNQSTEVYMNEGLYYPDGFTRDVINGAVVRSSNVLPSSIGSGGSTGGTTLHIVPVANAFPDPLPPGPPAPFPTTCHSCIQVGKTWCTKDHNCHNVGSPFNPCAHTECCASLLNPLSKCECKSCAVDVDVAIVRPYKGPANGTVHCGGKGWEAVKKKPKLDLRWEREENCTVGMEGFELRTERVMDVDKTVGIKVIGDDDNVTCVMQVAPGSPWPSHCAFVGSQRHNHLGIGLNHLGGGYRLELWRDIGRKGHNVQTVAVIPSTQFGPLLRTKIRFVWDEGNETSV